MNPSRIEETNSIVLAVRKRFWAEQQRQFGATENNALNASSLPQLASNPQHLFAGLGQLDVVQQFTQVLIMEEVVFFVMRGN